MKIRIHSGKQRLWIPIPNVLLCSAPAIQLIRLAIPPKLGITKEQITLVLQELKRSRALLHGLPLVEVYDSDGSYVKITL